LRWTTWNPGSFVSAALGLPIETREYVLILTAAAPKGCSVLENSKSMRYWVKAWGIKRPDARVLIVQEGTPLPKNLILVQQGDSYTWSIDPVGKQSLTELNDNINSFLSESAAVITPEQWLKAYPSTTEEKKPRIIDPRGEKKGPRSKVVTPLDAPSAKTVKYGPRLGVRH
jgi:hypothetical protein